MLVRSLSTVGKEKEHEEKEKNCIMWQYYYLTGAGD